MFGLLLGLTPFFFARSADAGILSFLGSIFGGTGGKVAEASRQTASDSLYSMPLLAAPNNTNLQAGKRDRVALGLVQDNALLPAVGPLGSIADVEHQSKTDTISLYTVREGESLTAIAKMFGVSVNTIIWANDLKRGTNIRPGDVLVILPVSGIKHTVKKGDTLGSVAKKYKGNLEEILAFNDLLSTDSLTEGQVIIIPDGELAPASVPAASSKRVVTAKGGIDIAGYFLRPIIGGIRTVGVHGNNGVDLANSCGSLVRASAAGTVIVAKGYGWNGGYGNYIVISHPNGTQTLYGHNAGIMVAQGQQVAEGETIASVGSTGRSTGCHLHFEVRGARNPF